MLSRNARLRLGRRSVGDDHRDFKLAGRFVAVVYTVTFARAQGASKTDDIGQTLVVRDLRTGRVVFDARDARARHRIFGHVVLRTNGSVAWMGGKGVQKHDSTGTVVRRA